MKITVSNVLWTIFYLLLAVGIELWGFFDRPQPAFGGESVVAIAIVIYAIWNFIDEAEKEYEEYMDKEGIRY